MSRTNVLIVGAGPTGLTLAIELASRGVAVRVIDKSPEHFPGSRGKGLAPRSREVFDNLGIQDQVQRSGWEHLAYRRWANGELLSDSDKTPDPAAGIPYATGILIAQWRVEEILREKLAEYDVIVNLGSELTEFTQSVDAVTATLGTGEEIVADYLVGCDGGRSTVRKSVNVGFEGESGPQAMLIGDVLVEGLEPDAWYMWSDSTKGFVALCPFRDWPAWQFQAVRISDFSASGELPPPTIELFQEIFDDIAAIPGVKLSDPSWLSTYRINVRMADKFRFDRVFLAGDAAHVHPPAGGLGMNTGIQDAHNLGWKLALVLSGKADQTLLDTYNEERVPIAEWTLGVSAKELRAIGDALDGKTQDDAAHDGGTAVERPTERGFRPRGELQQGQLALGYRWSPLAKTLVERPEAAPQAGDRAPDSPCQTETGEPLRLFDLFRQPNFTLLGFGEETRETIEAAIAQHPVLTTAHLVKTLTESNVNMQHIASVDVVHVAGVDVPHVEGGDVPPVGGVDVVDVEGHAHREYAVSEPTLFLVRPDGHIGVVADPARGQAVLDYLTDLGKN
ncbi:MAG TPA: FAD-dependent monooxygenase [Pseudonocardiaceae bacterium]|jgi:2-polyprenyl-6-methoxyphenol hydroxylase-like FAD-dependent oxidoreductase|nr:FAD-dependent monooxygenase [Pseudonocardiaceae bacterium]